MKKTVVTCAAAAALLAGMVSAPADVITLTDGSRVVGKVVELTDGKLVFETQFAGTLEIDANLVDNIESEQRLNVAIETGDRLVGPLEHNEALDEVVVSTELGQVPVPVERIQAIWPEGGESPELREMKAEVARINEEFEAKRAKWSASIEFGALYQEGNSDVLEGRLKGELKRKSDKDLLRFYAIGEYAEENDDRSAAEAKLGSYYEYLFNERFYWYGRSELEYDEFESLDLRVTLSTGPGFYWIKKPEHELKTFAGFGYLHETFMDDTTQDSAQLDIGLNYRLDIYEWLRFTHDAQYHPTFDGIDNYRLEFDTAVRMPLGDSKVWSLKLGVLHEYDSKPRPGVERLDTTYYANLLAEFE